MKTKQEKQIFHSLTAKLLFLAKRGRPDILTPVSVMTARTNDPDEDDWAHLRRIVSYLMRTKHEGIKLKPGNTLKIEAYVDAAYAAHPDGKGVTGVVIKVGGATVYCQSSKQKLVVRSSTEAELVAIDDAMGQILWTRNVLEAQGYSQDQQPAILYQDNQSTMWMANNGRSNKKRTKHINQRYYFITDQVTRGTVKIVYKSTKDMIADLLTKPIQGSRFEKLKEAIGIYPGKGKAKTNARSSTSSHPDEVNDNEEHSSKPSPLQGCVEERQTQDPGMCREKEMTVGPRPLERNKFYMLEVDE